MFEVFGLTIAYVVVWLVIAILFAVIEGFTLGLTAIWFAGGALLAMLAAFIGLNFWIQFLAFIMGSAVFLFYTRPLAVKVFKIGKVKTNVDSLIGKRGIVLKELQPDALGQVKVQGQIWSSKPVGVKHIEEGKSVEVKAIEGVKLIVEEIKEE